MLLDLHFLNLLLREMIFEKVICSCFYRFVCHDQRKVSSRPIKDIYLIKL